MRQVDMRKLPAAAQEERRRQVIGLRQAGMTYGAIAEQVGLSRTGVFNICQRFAAEGAKGLVSKPRGRKPDEQRLLDAAQEAEVQALICRHTPDELGLPFALWSRAAVRALIAHRCGVELAVRTVGKYLARWGCTAQKPIRRAYEQDPAGRCGAGCGGTTRPSSRKPSRPEALSSGVTRPACARMTCAAAPMPRGAGHPWFGFATDGPG
jgi:transposase